MSSTPLEPSEVRGFLLGKTISGAYVHTDEVGAIDWIALDFVDGAQAEISAYGMHGMEAGLEVEVGTRIRDIYRVTVS